MAIDQRFTQCTSDGCTRMSVDISGKCLNHRKNYKNDHTSDGIHTGSTPKLSEEQVVQARRMRAAFKTNREIAQHFGVALTTLRRHLDRGKD